MALVAPADARRQWLLNQLLNRIGANLEDNAICSTSAPPDLTTDAIPESWDARDEWPDCVPEVIDQGECGSCWAVSTSSMLSWRSCIAHDGVGPGLVLSAQELLECEDESNACDGGYIDHALVYLEEEGVALDACLNYLADETDESCSAAQEFAADACAESEGTTRFSAQECYRFSSSDLETVQRELMTRGPIVAGYSIYDNFADYEEGVHVPSGDASGGHAVVVTGWGVDEESGELYWSALNSWGDEWGENGYFRIQRGTNAANFETYMYTAPSQDEDAIFDCEEWGTCPSPCSTAEGVGEFISDCALGPYRLFTIGGLVAFFAVMGLTAVAVKNTGPATPASRSKARSVSSASAGASAPEVNEPKDDDVDAPPPYSETTVDESV